MKFLIAILCLVSMTVFGAVPSYEKFVGAGGIVVTLNPPNGNVTIDGTGIGGTNAGQTAIQVTNIAQYFSTNPISGWQWGSSRLTNLAAFYTNVMLLNTSSNLVFAISNAPNNTLIRLAPGTYPLVATVPMSNGYAAINIFNKTNLAIQGAAGGLSILDAGSNLGCLIQATNVNGFTLLDLTIKGYMLTNYTLYWADYGWAGVELTSCQNVLVQRVSFIDHFDHGIIDARGGNRVPFGGSPDGPYSTNNIVVTHCYFDNIGSWRAEAGGVDHTTLTTGDGTALPGGGWTSEENYFVNCRRAGEPYGVGGAIVNNTIYRGNVIRNCIEHAITLAGQTNMHNILMEDNHISWDQGYNRRGTNPHPGSCGILINGGQRHILRRNIILNAPADGIQVTGSSDQFGITLEQNIIRGQYADAYGGGIFVTSEGVGVYNHREMVIRQNIVEGKRFWGLRLGAVRDSLIEGNTLINTGTNGSYYAMAFAAGGGNLSSNVTVTGNIIRNNGLANLGEQGILIQSGTKALTLHRNEIEGFVTPIDNSAGNEVIYLQQLDNLRNVRNDITNTFAAIRLGGQGTNKFTYFGWDSNLWGGTFGSGLTFTGGVLSATGGGGGGGSFNVNQFSATGVTNLIAGAAQTNANFFGRGTNHNEFWIESNLWVEATSIAGDFLDLTWGGGYALASDGSKRIVESVTTATELGYVSGVISSIQTQLSNDVRILAGTGGIVVTPLAVGPIMQYTIDGSAGSGEANTASTLGNGLILTAGKSAVDLRFNSISNGSGLLGTSNANVITFSADWSQIASTTNVVGVSNYVVGVSNRLNTFTTALSNNVATASSNNVTVAPGSNITITTNGSGGVTTYTVNGSAGGGGNFSTNVTDGSATFFGTGVGAFRLYDNAQTEYFGLEAPFDVTSNNVTRAFSNSLAGVVVGQHIATGTNQAQRIQLAAGQYVTYNGTAYVASNLPSAGGGGGGTNYPPVIAIGTNVNVGVGVRQSVTVNTNVSFKLVLTGTPLNGEHVKISVSNYSAVAIYMTNTFFDKTVASNVTVSAIPALSLKTFNLVNSSNLLTTGTRWELDGMVGKEMELAAAGGLVMHTNAAESIVTISNSIPANYSTNADGTALFFSTNYSGMSNTLGLIISNSFTAPSNTVQEAGIGFDTSVFTTGGAAGTNWRPRGEFKLIPTISAAPAGATWVLQTRTNATGPAFTNMQVSSLGNAIFPGGFVTLGGTSPVYVSGEATAILQLGLDASSGVSHTLKAADGSGTSIAGGSLTVSPGKATGSGAPGRVLVAVGTNSTASSAAVQNYGASVGAGGTLKVNTSVSTNLGGGEDDLTTYSVPQAQLSVNGDFIEFVVWGTTAANANTKQLKVYFGATVLIDGGAVVLNGVSWKAHGRVVRTGAATQTATCELTVGGTLLSAVNGTICLTTAPAETLAAAVTFKVTGTSAVAPADADIVQNGMTVKWYPGQ